MNNFFDNISVNDLIERSKLPFEKYSLGVLRLENNERLVTQDELQLMGFRCEPFWDLDGDIEGECYLDYIKDHPDFSLSVREEVAKMLLIAQQNLPSSWSIVLKAGYRPIEVQRKLLKVLIEISRASHPGWDDDQHLEYARAYVSDPSIMCPPHVTGGAVDLDIFDNKTKRFVDMGCKPNTDGEVAHLHSDKIKPDQYSNRLILLDAMLKAGFAPLQGEWWHFQYGETYWAAFYGHEKTVYNLILE